MSESAAAHLIPTKFWWKLPWGCFWNRTFFLAFLLHFGHDAEAMHQSSVKYPAPFAPPFRSGTLEKNFASSQQVVGKRKEGMGPSILP